MKIKLLICTLIMLAIPTGIPVEAAHGRGSTLKNAVVLIIRHAEDAAHGDGISPAGQARAEAYVDYFKTFSADGKPTKLDALFAARDSVRSHRPRLTLEPTARAFGLKIDSEFKTRQITELVREIENLPSGKNILICWRHSQIPQLLDALGAESKNLLPRGKWPGAVFGWLILLRYDESGRLVESKLIKENLTPPRS
jgi:hypothetical protein